MPTESSLSLDSTSLFAVTSLGTGCSSGPVSSPANHNFRNSTSWWGNPRGPVSSLNAGALAMFEKIMQHSSWRNLHWLPHAVLVYEIRVVDGYGMRWSQNRSVLNTRHEWVFRGFVEPMMQDGHELRWRH
ncbi:hypothetical protein ACEPAH_7544 [Sanghuangporus vaninii]